MKYPGIRRPWSAPADNKQYLSGLENDVFDTIAELPDFELVLDETGKPLNDETVTFVEKLSDGNKGITGVAFAAALEISDTIRTAKDLDAFVFEASTSYPNI